MDTLYFLAFGVICTALVVLPLLPAWREWRRPTDRDPLPISPDYTSATAYFAEALRDKVAAVSGSDYSSLSAHFDYVDGMQRNCWTTRGKAVVAHGPLMFETGTCCVRTVFCDANIKSASHCSFSALCADGNIILGEQCEIHQWAHAQGLATIGAGSVVLRRLSSSTEIQFGARCCFERVTAPLVRFGSAGSFPAPDNPPAIAGNYADIPNAIERTPSLFMVRGDCTIPPGRIYQGSLIVTGKLTVLANTAIVGSIKTAKGALLGPYTRISGAIISKAAIHAGDGVSIDGPIMSETDVLIGSGSEIGTCEYPTTITAKNIIIVAGAVTHGTVWAKQVGTVVSYDCQSR